MEDTLVICVGNTARGDDGVAHEVARILARTSPDLHVITAVALDVTHAEDAAHAGTVVVVDAERRHSPDVDTRQVKATSMGRDTHGTSPGALLGLARQLYGSAPAMWLVTVAAPEMEHSEELSSIAMEAAQAAAEAVGWLIDSG